MILNSVFEKERCVGTAYINIPNVKKLIQSGEPLESDWTVVPNINNSETYSATSANTSTKNSIDSSIQNDNIDDFDVLHTTRMALKVRCSLVAADENTSELSKKDSNAHTDTTNTSDSLNRKLGNNGNNNNNNNNNNDDDDYLSSFSINNNENNNSNNNKN